MSKPQNFTSLLSPTQGKFPQPPPTSSDKSRHFKFTDPSPSKSSNKSFSKFIQPGYSSALQELSAEISDIYEFRQKCFEKIKSLETVIERNRGTYENEINYMNEYIKLLKRKLSKGKGINESLDFTCESCKEKEKTLSLLTGELEVYEAAVRNTEGQNRILKNEVVKLRQELESKKKLNNFENQAQEFLEIIAELEEAKQAEEKLVYELRLENKKLEIQMRERNEACEVGKNVGVAKEVFRERVESVSKMCEKEMSKFFEMIKGIEARVDKNFRDLSSVQWKVEENVQLRRKVQESEEIVERVIIKEKEVSTYKELFYEVKETLRTCKKFKDLEDQHDNKQELGVNQVRKYKEYVESLVRDIKSSEESAISLKEQVRFLEEYEKSAKIQIENLEKTSENLQQTLKQTQDELISLKDENTINIKEKAENAQNCLKAMEKFENLQEKFLQINERAKILQESKENNETLTEELKRKLWKTEESLKKKQEKIQNLHENLEKLGTLQARCEEFELKFVEKEIEIEKLQNILNNYLKNEESVQNEHIEPVLAEDLSNLDQEMAQVLEEKSALQYLDLMQKLLDKMKNLFNSNEALKSRLEKQESEIHHKESELANIIKEKDHLLQEHSTLESTLNEKSVLVDKFQHLLDTKNKELGKLQEIMQDLIENSSKLNENSKNPEFSLIPEESSNKYLEIIKDLSESLKKVTEAKEKLEVENDELKNQVAQLVSEISLQEGRQNSLSSKESRSSKSSRRDSSDENCEEVQDEHFLSSYEEEKRFEGSLDMNDEQLTGDLNKCVSILSPLEPNFYAEKNETVLNCEEGKESGNLNKCVSILSPLEPVFYADKVGVDGDNWEVKGNKPGLNKSGSHLEQEIENLQQEIQALRENNENLNKLKDDLQEMIRGLTGKFEGFGKICKEIQEKLENSEEKADIKEENKIHPEEKNLVGEIEAVLLNLVQEKEELAKKFSGLSEENKNLLSQAIESEEKLLEAEKKSGEIENLKNLNKLLENELKGLQTEMQKNDSALIESQILQEKFVQVQDLNANLFKEKENLNAQIEDLLNEVQSIEKKLHSELDSKSLMESELNSAKAAESQLREELVEYEKIKMLKDQLESEQNEFKHQISSVIPKLQQESSFKDCLAQLTSDYINIKEANEDLNEKYLKDQGLNKKLMAEKDRLDQRSQELEQENKSLQESISKIISDLHEQNTIKDEFLKVLNENRALVSNEKQLKGKNEKLEQDLIDSKEQIEDLKKQIDELQTKVEEFQSQLKEKEQMRMDLESSMEKIQEIENEKIEVIQELQKNKEYLKNNEELVERLQAQCEDLSQILNENQEMKKKIKGLESSEKNLESLQSKLDETQLELTEMSKEKLFALEKLENTQKKLEDLEKDSENFKKTAEKLAKTVEGLEQEQRVTELSEGSLRDKLKKIQAENENLLKGLEKTTEYKDIIHGLSKAKESADEENKNILIELENAKSLLKKLEETELENEKLLVQVEALQEKCGKLESIENHLKTELEKAIDSHSSLNSDHLLQESTLSQTIKENQELLNSLQKTEEELKDLKENFNELKQINEKMLQDVGAKKELEAVIPDLLVKNQVTEKKNKELESRVNDLISENSKLETKIHGIEKKCEELENSENSSKGKLSQALSDLLSLNDQLKKTENELKAAGIENSKLSQNLLQMTEDFEKMKEKIPKHAKDDLEKTKKDLLDAEEKLSILEENLKNKEEKLEKTEDVLEKTQEVLKSTEKTLESTEIALKETEDSLERTKEDQEKTEKKLKNLEEALKKSREKQQIAEKNFEKTRETLKNTEKISQNNEQALLKTEENLRKTEENLRKTQEKLEKTNESFNKILEEYESLAKEKDLLFTENGEISDKNMELASKLEYQPDISGVVSSLVNANKILDRENNDKQAELNMVQAELSDIKDEFKRLAKAYQDLEKENSELVRALKQSSSLPPKTSHESATQPVHDLLLRQNNEDLRPALSDLLLKNENLLKENAELNKQLDELVGKKFKDAEEAGLKDLKDVVPELSEEVSAILKGLQDENDRLKEVIAGKERMALPKKTGKKQLRSGKRGKKSESSQNSEDEEDTNEGIQGKKEGMRQPDKQKKNFNSEKIDSGEDDFYDRSKQEKARKKEKNQGYKVEIGSDSDSNRPSTPEFVSLKNQESGKKSKKYDDKSGKQPKPQVTKGKVTSKREESRSSGNSSSEQHEKDSNHENSEDSFSSQDHKQKKTQKNSPLSKQKKTNKPEKSTKSNKKAKVVSDESESSQESRHKKKPVTKSPEISIDHNKGRPANTEKFMTKEDLYREHPRNPEKSEEFYQYHPKDPYFKQQPKNTGRSEEPYYIPDTKYIENPKEQSYRDQPMNIKRPEDFQYSPEVNRNLPSGDKDYYRSQPGIKEGRYYKDDPKNVERYEDPYYKGNLKHPQGQYYREHPEESRNPEYRPYKGQSNNPEDFYYQGLPKSSSLERPGYRPVPQYYEMQEDLYPKSSSLERPPEGYYRNYPPPNSGSEDRYAKFPEKKANQEEYEQESNKTQPKVLRNPEVQYNKYPEEPYFRSQPMSNHPEFPYKNQYFAHSSENPQYYQKPQYKEDSQKHKGSRHHTKSSDSHPLTLNPFPESPHHQTEKPQKRSEASPPLHSQHDPNYLAYYEDYKPNSKLPYDPNLYSEHLNPSEINRKIPYVEYPPEYFSKPADFHTENPNDDIPFHEKEKLANKPAKNPEKNPEPRKYPQDVHYIRSPQGYIAQDPYNENESKRSRSERPPDSQRGPYYEHYKNKPVESPNKNSEEFYNPAGKRGSSEKPQNYDEPRDMVPGYNPSALYYPQGGNVPHDPRNYQERYNEGLGQRPYYGPEPHFYNPSGRPFPREQAYFDPRDKEMQQSRPGFSSQGKPSYVGSEMGQYDPDLYKDRDQPYSSGKFKDKSVEKAQEQLGYYPVSSKIPENKEIIDRPKGREESWHEVYYKKPEETFIDQPESVEINVDLPITQESIGDPLNNRDTQPNIKQEFPKNTKNTEEIKHSDAPAARKHEKEEKIDMKPKESTKPIPETKGNSKNSEENTEKFGPKEETEENRPKIISNITKNPSMPVQSGHSSSSLPISQIPVEKTPNEYQIKKSPLTEVPKSITPTSSNQAFIEQKPDAKFSQPLLSPQVQSDPKAINPNIAKPSDSKPTQIYPNSSSIPHAEPHTSIPYQYINSESAEKLVTQNTQLTISLQETLDRVEHQQKYIEDLLEKLKSSQVADDKQDLPSDLSELLSKIKYQNELINELENKNNELEGRFNRIRNKNNLLESNTKKYSENVEKVFKDVNKKMMVIEKSISNKEEKIKAIYSDYLKFKQKYINGFQEKSKALLDSVFDPKNQEFQDSLIGSDIDKDDLIKILKGRVEFLQGKIEALVKSNFVTKEIIENIGNKVHDAIEMIKVE